MPGLVPGPRLRAREDVDGVPGRVYPTWASLTPKSGKPDFGDQPGHDEGQSTYFIACGLMGEPVPPVMIRGGPQKKNS
jgi:hypothetical protein